MSKITKSSRRAANAFSVLSFLLTVAPIVIFGIQAFIAGEPHEKTTLGLTITTALILVAINAMFKLHIRSVLWILVLGIYVCLDNIQTMLLVMAITTILDEFVAVPLRNKFKKKYEINREIDKRI